MVSCLCLAKKTGEGVKGQLSAFGFRKRIGEGIRGLLSVVRTLRTSQSRACTLPPVGFSSTMTLSEVKIQCFFA